MEKTTYVTIRIDFEDDGRYDERYYADEVAAMAADLVVERANSHNHTIENGITICNIENCGENN